MAEERKRNTSDVTMSLGMANLLGIPLFIAVAGGYIGAFYMVWGRAELFAGIREAFGPFKLILFLFAGVVLHEALHGLGWKLAARVPWRSMSFGINWKVLTPYAHCTVPMPAGAYRFGGALPGVVLGFVPATFGLLVKSGLLTFWGAFFFGAAAGDILVLWLLRNVPSRALVRDHPTRAGCEVVENSEQGT